MAHFSLIFPIFHRIWLLALEQSLQVVDSRINNIGLPYWDYRRDQSGDGPCIFTDQFLGQATGSGVGYAVMDGKFKNWEVLRDTSMLLNESSVYSFLRSPLNLNKSPGFTRRANQVCGQNFGLATIRRYDICEEVGPDMNNW